MIKTGNKKRLKAKSGVALLTVTITAITLSIALTVALPGVKNHFRREKEDNLRFILGEFRRAVEKYQRCHNSYPQNLQNLLKDEQGNRFLRRQYVDPFTGKFDWQVSVASDGFIVHSSSSEKSISGIPYSDFK
jgi:type II secretory pathway pseudopilin PulG